MGFSGSNTSKWIFGANASEWFFGSNDSKEKDEAKKSTTTAANDSKEKEEAKATATANDDALLDSQLKPILCHLLSTRKECQDVSLSTNTSDTATTHVSPNKTHMTSHKDNPPTDFKVYNAKYEYIINMPGFNSIEFETRLEQDNTELVVTGKRIRDSESKGAYIMTDDRRVGEIHARYELPGDADTEEIVMSNWKGLVTVTIAKQSAKQIRVTHI